MSQKNDPFIIKRSTIKAKELANHINQLYPDKIKCKPAALAYWEQEIPEFAKTIQQTATGKHKVYDRTSVLIAEKIAGLLVQKHSLRMIAKMLELEIKHHQQLLDLVAIFENSGLIEEPPTYDKVRAVLIQMKNRIKEMKLI